LARWWEWDGTQAGPQSLEPASDWKIGLGLVSWFIGIAALIVGLVAGLFFQATGVLFVSFAVLAICFVIGSLTLRPTVEPQSRR
jgi:membrane protein implicated in regulation of membrane protease activity